MIFEHRNVPLVPSTTSTSPSKNDSAAAANCASKLSAVYVRIGGHDLAPHTNAKCTRGSRGSTQCARLGSFGPKGPGESDGFPIIAPMDAAPGRFPRNAPCSMSSHDHRTPPMSYRNLSKNVSLSKNPALGGPTAHVTCTIMAL